MTEIRRLVLQDFRSYPAAMLAADTRLVALIGENGAGKTNLLEAISLFSPGRGLRRADLPAMARAGGTGGFAVSLDLADEAQSRLGVGLSEPDADGRRTRLARLNGAEAGSVGAFADLVRIVWLTPEQDGLFRGAAGERRRFLDRLVLAVDSGHATRSSALEKALRERNRLLEDAPRETQWLDGLERQIAELAVAVAAARAETVARLSALIDASRDDRSPFPFARLSLQGEIDVLVAEASALQAEDEARRRLRDGRARDTAAGRTLFGPQASDLAVRHGPKDIPAEQGSTGEQKALLVGLVLAHARLVGLMSGIKPIILLDEIAAHFDPRRRAALYTELAQMGAQVWMTGADHAPFTELPEQATRFIVAPGTIKPA
jgi:DNA replication and repair protein RecF